jgi:hypothetical protein
MNLEDTISRRHSQRGARQARTSIEFEDQGGLDGIGSIHTEEASCSTQGIAAATVLVDDERESIACSGRGTEDLIAKFGHKVVGAILELDLGKGRATPGSRHIGRHFQKAQGAGTTNW